MSDRLTPSDRWIEMARVLEEALAMPAPDRLMHVRRVCGTDSALFGEVAELLACHEEEEVLRAGGPGGSKVHVDVSRIGSRFERLSTLGSGGFGRVYKAFDRTRHHWVALKVLTHVNPDHLGRFKQEFRRTAEIRHPNLVRLYELFSDEAQWFITMELI